MMLRTLCLLAAAVLTAATSTASDREYQWEGVERIIAIGDVHGAYDNLVQTLRNARLIDGKERWIGGTTHLVQNGDIVDRGPHSRKVMDLLMKLEEKAEDAGGAVHVLIGNHEAMNLVGILDLVSDKEYAAFVERDSRKRHDQTFDRYYEDLRREARETGEEIQRKNVVRKRFDEDYPLGYIEHRRAFGKDGRYGRWIRGLNTSILINGTLFSHGDWSEKFSRIGVEEVNRRVRQELSGEANIQTGLTFAEESPLQFRGIAHTTLTKASQQAAEPLVDRVLTNLGAKRMVVGHTLTQGVIESRFGGKHVSLDVGMLEIYHGGHRIALEIQGDTMRAVHDGGSVELPAEMNETTLPAYIEAVAKVDPENVDVQLAIVDMLEESGRLMETAPLLEKLFADRPEHVPFRYRDVLGSHYLSRGNTKAAETQFRRYIEGLHALVQSTPSNLNLSNLLARFCLDKGIQLELADDVIRAAVEQEPLNYSFRLTMARVQIARNEHSDALDVLSGATGAGVFEYETHFVSGMAYLGMGDREKARASFRRAVEAEPDRTEAKAELEKLDSVPQ